MSHLNRNGCEIEYSEHRQAGSGRAVVLVYMVVAAFVAGLLIARCAVPA